MAAQNLMASSRECRRFIRFRMRLSPDCSERCRCGISRSSSANAAISAGSASIVSMEESRRRGSSGDQPQDGAREAERHAAGKMGAVGGEVDAGQHHLAVAFVGQACAPRRPRRPRGTERDGPRPIGDNAKGAAVITAVLHFRHRRASARRARHHVRCVFREPRRYRSP